MASPLGGSGQPSAVTVVVGLNQVIFVSPAEAGSAIYKRCICGTTEVVRTNRAVPGGLWFLSHFTQDSAALRPGLSFTRLRRSGSSSLPLYGLEESQLSLGHEVVRANRAVPGGLWFL